MRINGATSINGNFTITDLYLFEGGRYNERFLRSLKMGSINDAVIDRLADEISRTNGRGFSAGSIASARTPVITLEDSVDRERDYIELVNGWDKKHFCFIMKIVEEAASIHHAAKTYLISGYTDKMEYTKYTKSIPDDLEFYVNSILETSNDRASNNNQLFSSINGSSSSNKLYMMRPQDVLSRYSYSKVRETQGMDSSYRSDWIHDRGIRASSRNNNIASNYLAKTLTGIHKTRLEMIGDRMVSDDDDLGESISRHLGGSARRNLSRATELEDEVESVRSMVGEDSAEEYEFIRAIKSMARETHSAGCFRLRQLKRVCPDVETITSVNVLAKQEFSRTGLTNRDNSRIGDMDGERFGNSSTEEIIATNVLNSFATVASSCFVMMMDIMFALRYDEDQGRYEWDFEISYDDNGRDEEGSVVFLDMVSDELQTVLIDRVAQTMIDSVLNSYSRFGYDVLVGIRFNMNREMFVTVAIDTDEPIEFCSAIFCDSLTPPVLSNQERRGAKIGQEVTSLYNEIHKVLVR